MTRPFEPIAIVGQSCVLPGALTPEALWDAVSQGRDLVRAAPEGRWGLDKAVAMAVPLESPQDSAWTDRGGYVHGFDEVFDPTGFDLPVEEVLGLDPLFQWVLHTGREALSHAGAGTDLSRTGVVMGNLSFPSYLAGRFAETVWLRRQNDPRLAEHALGPSAANRFMSGLPAHLLAKALGLGGRAFALDAACASSLYAIKLACDRLHDQRADAMLAGAVSCADDLFIHVGFHALEALSKSGRSRPFHREADGLLPAEGAAFVVLKRLDDAVRDGDGVLGVIRGVGLSNDGRGRGLLAPAEEGQARAIRKAYEMAGLEPGDVSLAECHATGTAVGDATEIRSLGSVYAALEEVPIGSLKSNLGHLITAAGMAGLLKLLAAMKNAVRPPTLHTEDPNPALEGSPFRLLREAERWPSEGPRRASLSAFGFGGNNAHLLVEEYDGSTTPAVRRAEASGGGSEIAVVALSVVAAGVDGEEDFAAALASGESRLRTRPDGSLAGVAEPIELPLAGLRFPPRDLEQTLPQQLLLLRTARRAVDSLATDLPRESTGVLIGMGLDAEIPRYGMRWRMVGWPEVTEAWLRRAEAAVVPGIRSAGVVGTMPNMPANRLNSQFDFGGPSASYSSEELSGTTALELAMRALSAGELDAALVGAVDLSCEPVQEEAARQLLSEGRHVPGDAAVVLVLKRLADARRAGDRILATLRADNGDGSGALRIGTDGHDLTPQFGHAHAASALLHLAAAVTCCQYRLRPSQGQPAAPWLEGPRRAEVRFEALGGQRSHVRVEEETASSVAPLSIPRLYVYSGRDRQAVAERLHAGYPDPTAGPVRLVIVARDDTELSTGRERALKVLSGDVAKAPGVHFRDQPLSGDLAYVFTGAAAAYRGMGRELLLAFPELAERLGKRIGKLEGLADWVYAVPDGQDVSVLQQLWGSSFLCQAHTELSGLLGLRPAATIGYSSGESNALMALGVWSDFNALRHDTNECGLFTDQLAGGLAAVKRAWNLGDDDEVRWTNWVLSAPIEDVHAALEGEDRAYLTLASSPEDAVIGGDAEACQRVIRRLGTVALPLGYPLAVHCPVVEEVAEEWLDLHRRPTTEAPGVRVYTNAGGGRSYEPTTENAARAILGQAVTTVDFPALVKKAWDDGVRIFLEHGPRGMCSRWIEKTLSRHDIAQDAYVAISYDRGGRSLEQCAAAVAELVTAGVDVDHVTFNERPRPAGPAKPDGPCLTFPAHWPEIELPPLEMASEEDLSTLSRMETVMTESGEAQWMAPAPALPPVSDELENVAAPTPVAFVGQAVPADPEAAGPTNWPKPQQPPQPLQPPPPQPPPPPQQQLRPQPRQQPTQPPRPLGGEGRGEGAPLPAPVLANVTDLHARMVAVRQEYLDSQTHLWQQFLGLQQTALDQLVRACQNGGELAGPVVESRQERGFGTRVPPHPSPLPQRGEGAGPSASPSDGPSGSIDTTLAPIPETRSDGAPRRQDSKREAPASRPLPPLKKGGRGDSPLPGPKFDRRDLEVLASGKISSLFGPLFERQDGFERQVRMPEPPFLLADRVTGIDAEPGSMKLGTIWTETDVTDDSWFLHNRRMPAGLMIEAGQADLLLISWLGIDFLNRGERVYRLLGCECTYRGELPKPGDTLCYDIHVDGHAQQGDVRLFFFHYDCRVNGEIRLSVRGGQAGFFCDQELDDSAGVLWDPLDEEPEGERLDPPRVETTRSSFSHAQLVALSEGRAYECMGPGYELAASHTMTPRLQNGRMLLLDRVTDFDPRGGPWKRGYLRAVEPLTPESWLFQGHFKNDPCVPGTVILEACLQTMSFYLIAMGFTLERDGWRFEPVPEVTSSMRCRGQIIPSSKELVYEIFVHEVHDGPYPTLFADLLCTVDGLKAFHARRAGLRLVPDWPLSVFPPPAAEAREQMIAEVDGFAFDYRSLLACAWGKPTEAFGEMYRRFDGPMKVARLPGPPYHFMSRIAGIDGRMGVFEPGAVIEAVYDVSSEAWYFEENGYPTMPFAVLLEAGLQPCGWLASFAGSALLSEGELQFRNLDGTGTLHTEVLRSAGAAAPGPITSRIELTGTSQSAGVLIVRFTVEMRLDGRRVYDMETAFGFFPREAMQNQVGLPANDEERAALEAPSDVLVDLKARPERYCGGSLRLAGPKLLMIDRITGFWPEGGKAGLGRLRAERDIDPNDWFFKAHFFQDPVQPGSLGIEAMLQLIQFYMIHTNMGEGIERPRFEPIATGMDMTWKYRGQVLPTNRQVALELEIVETGRDELGPYAVGELFYWIDGKRIYSAVHTGMRIVSGAEESQKKAPASLLQQERFDVGGVRDYWRQCLETGPWPGEDIYCGLIERFVRRVVIEDPDAFRAVHGRPVLFLANHQVGIESMLFSIIGSQLAGLPILALAKQEHRESWLGRLVSHCFSYPGVKETEVLTFIDREDLDSIPLLVRKLGERLARGANALLVHAAGTRSLSCRQPVEALSGTFVDAMMEAKAPIVPVRFTGGLPAEPLDQRIEFPLGCGRQDYWIGKPILPEELGKLGYGERRTAVIEAINSLGPSNAVEEPLPPDPAFVKEVEEWIERAGVSSPHAVIFKTLEKLEAPGLEIQLLLTSAQSGDLAAVPDDDAGRWLAELVRRLGGVA